MAFVAGRSEIHPVGPDPYIGSHARPAERRVDRFHFHFVPTGSSWLDQVERWFDHLATKRIRRGTFRGEAELCEALYGYIENRNEGSGAFEWTATPEAIPERIDRNRLSTGGFVSGH